MPAAPTYSRKEKKIKSNTKSNAKRGKKLIAGKKLQKTQRLTSFAKVELSYSTQTAQSAPPPPPSR